MQLPLAYLDAAVIEEVPIEVWREIFEATGWPESLESKRSSFGHQDVLHALEQDNPTDNLLQALETLHTLGTEAGREAIVSAMNDRRVPLDALPADKGEREFALLFYLAQRRNASLADVFARAQTMSRRGAINAATTSSWERKRGRLQISMRGRRNSTMKFCAIAANPTLVNMSRCRRSKTTVRTCSTFFEATVRRNRSL